MKLGRISVTGPDGAESRLVLVIPEEQRVIDLKCTLHEQLIREGASRPAAMEYAGGVFPGSVPAAISLGAAFTQADEKIHASRPDAFSIPFDQVSWLPASDPSVMRDELTFIEPIKGFHEKSPMYRVEHVAEV